MIVTVKDKEVQLKYSFRCFFIFENIMGRSFQPTTTTDVLVFFYSVIMASDKDLNYTFDEFLDDVDAKPELIVEFSTFIADQLNKTKSLSPEPTEEEKKTEKDLNQ